MAAVPTNLIVIKSNLQLTGPKSTFHVNRVIPSPTDSVGSVNHDPTDPFQDAQYPYSGHDLDSI